MQNQIRIVNYNDRYAEDFARLNRTWLESYNFLEKADEMQLDQPDELIIKPGGKILLALEQERVIGTCALIRMGPTKAELAKLTVADGARGKGLGRRLTMAVIDEARFMGINHIVLLSNNKLRSAIRLYESIGFRHAALPEDVKYATADVYMELRLLSVETRKE